MRLRFDWRRVGGGRLTGCVRDMIGRQRFRHRLQCCSHCGRHFFDCVFVFYGSSYGCYTKRVGGWDFFLVVVVAVVYQTKRIQSAGDGGGVCVL